MSTVREKLWIWGHEEGSHNVWNGLNMKSRMTPAEGALYLGVPNMVMVRYQKTLAPVFRQYAISFRPLNKVIWSVVGAGRQREDGELDMVLKLAGEFPNITGVILDDFFRSPSERDNAPMAPFTPDQVADVKKQLTAGGRQLELWVVLYDYQTGLPVRDHLRPCDVMTYWTWKAGNLKDLKVNFERAEELAPGMRKVLGCYLYNYGENRPMPVSLMREQCETGLQWLKEGRIEGMIFLASCICDLELEAVEWTRKWIMEVGDQSL